MMQKTAIQNLFSYSIGMMISFCLGSCQMESHNELSSKHLAAAIVATKRQDFAAAQKDFELAINEAGQSDNKVQLPQILAKYADLQIAEKKFPAAEANLNRALRLFKQALVGENPDYERTTIGENRVDALSKLATVLTEQNKLGQAEIAAKSAWDESRQIIGSLKGHNDLGPQYTAIMIKEGKQNKAEEFETSSDAEFPEGTQHILEEKGHALLCRGQFQEAEKQFKVMRLLAKQRDTLIDFDLATRLLIICQYLAGDQARCEKAAREWVAETNKPIADVLLSRHRRSQALTVLALALENTNEKESKLDFTEAGQIDKLQSGLLLADIANCYLSRSANEGLHPPEGVPAEIAKQSQLLLLKKAETLYKRAFDLCRKEMKESDPAAYRMCMANLASTLASENKSAPAIESYRELFSLPDQSTWRGERVTYLDLLVTAHNFSEAQRVLGDIVEREQKSKEPRDGNQLACMFKYVRAALVLKRTEDAQILAKIMVASPQIRQFSAKERSNLRALAMQGKRAD